MGMRKKRLCSNKREDKRRCDLTIVPLGYIYGKGWRGVGSSSCITVNGRQEAIPRIMKATRSQMRKQRLGGRVTIFLEFHGQQKKFIRCSFVAIQTPKIGSKGESAKDGC